MEQNVSTDKNFLRNILVTRGDPFVCACPRLRSSRCRQTIVESSSSYFWSIWEQHVFFLIIVHSRMKIYEVLKRASVHLPVVVHYSTGTTTISASLVLKRVRTRLGQLGANISPDRSSLTPQVLIGNFLKHNYPLLYELQHINLLCLYLPKEDGVSPDAEYITQIIFSIFLQ